VVAVLMGKRITHFRVLVDTEELPFPKGCVVEVIGSLSIEPICLQGLHWTGVPCDFLLSVKDYRRLRSFVLRPETVIAATTGAVC
jgi:hypothetical protein